MGITLDPSTVLNTTLSNGNLTATSTATTNPSGAKGKAADAKTSGKLYFEFTGLQANGGSQASVGVATQSDTYSAVVSTGGGGGGILLFQGSNGVVFSGGASPGQISSTIVASDICAAAIDITNKKAWFKNITGGSFWNGGSSNNPATGVGGFSFTETSLVPWIGFGGGGTVGAAVTLNLKGAFNGAVPSGFIAWDNAPPPFSFGRVIT